MHWASIETLTQPWARFSVFIAKYVDDNLSLDSWFLICGAFSLQKKILTYLWCHKSVEKHLQYA